MSSWCDVSQKWALLVFTLVTDVEQQRSVNQSAFLVNERNERYYAEMLAAKRFTFSFDSHPLSIVSFSPPRYSSLVWLLWMEPEPISISVLLLNEDGWKIIGCSKNYCMFKLGWFCPATARDWILQSARCLIFLLFSIRLHRPSVHNLTVCASCIILYKELLTAVLWTCIQLQMRSHDNCAGITDIRWLEPRTKREICCRQACFLSISSHTHLWKEPPGCLAEMTSCRLACYGRMSSWKKNIFLLLLIQVNEYF